jgi:putative transposase
LVAVLIFAAFALAKLWKSLGQYTYLLLKTLLSMIHRIMPRIARIVAVGHPHHVTQRGNRRQDVFFEEGDFEAYLSLVAEFCQKVGTEVWAYCLMSNHVHMIMVPKSPDGLRGAIAEAHRRYTLMINKRQNWRGHLWQGRFSSFPMSEEHLIAAARYIELNPLRANMVKDPKEYPWSSARAHLTGEDDKLVKVAPLLELVPSWSELLSSWVNEDEAGSFRHHEKTGRPMGAGGFVDSLGKLTGRDLQKKVAGRKKSVK